MLRRDTAAGGSACLSGLELLAVGYAAADLLNDLAESSTHRHFNQTGVVDLSAQSKYLCALGLFGTHCGEPFRAVKDYSRNVGVCLNIVENSGLAVQTFFRRERRTGSGLAAVALDRGHESRFLAANERARAETKLDIEIKVGTENSLA